LGAAIGAAVVLALILVIVFFQWNWLRGPLAGEISTRLHRPVRIAGNLKVHPWSGSPWATLDDLRIGNPAWAGGGTMASAPRLTVRWTWPSVLAGRPVFPLVWARAPVVRLVSDFSGRQNWNFSGRKTPGRPAPSPIEHLVITDGRVSYADAKARANFTGTISTNETRGAGTSVVQGPLTVGGASWAGPAPMARISRLTIQARLLTAMAGRLELALVEADGGAVRLVSDAAGRDNWRTDPKPKPLKVPPIDHLVIRNAALTYMSARQRVNFVGAISGDERGPAAGLSTIRGALLVGGAPWAGPAPLARAPSFVVQLKLLPLMAGGKLVLPLIEADRPSVRLVKDVSGRASWQVGPGGTAKPLKLPTINNLIISNGALTYDDAKAKTHFTGTVSTSQTVNGSGRGTFVLNGKGVLNAAPFVARVTGGALVNVDASRPYRFDARVQTGATKLAVNGMFAHPFDFGQMSGRLTVSGPDFSNLYHLTGVALPNTPPYQLGAGFAVAGKTYAFRGIGGRMGDSDLAGSLSVNDTNGRPFVTADLTSRRLKLADLAAVIGGVPKNPAAHTLSPAQKIMAARLKAEHRFLPDARLDVTRLRTTDARLTYRATSVDAGRLPIRSLSLKLVLDHGLLTVDPLTMGLPQGDLAGMIRLDGRGATAAESMDMKLTNARLENLVGAGSANPPLEGGLYGRAKLAGSGDSVRAAAANANGALTVVIPGGEIRQAFAELLGIDATKGLFLLLEKSQKETPIRCAVADFRAQNGILTAQRIVLDTGVVLALGKGDIDLRNETINLQLSGKPKKFRLVRIGAPITVHGPLIAPKFGVDVGKAAGQLAIGALLGAVVAPLAAILPFVNPGLAKNADCAALMSEARARGAGTR